MAWAEGMWLMHFEIQPLSPHLEVSWDACGYQTVLMRPRQHQNTPSHCFPLESGYSGLFSHVIHTYNRLIFCL